MKYFVFIMLLSGSIKMFAQDFASPGTTWTYSDVDNNHHSSPRAIYSVADTVVNGHPSHLVVGNCTCSGSTGNYIYGLNRRVYMYHYQLGDFTLLYDFNKNAGENYIIYPPNAADSIYIVVDSTGMDTINGQLRKTQFVHTQSITGLPLDFNGKIIEGIGSTQCLYPQYLCTPITNGLRCYQDPVVGFYDTHLAPSCDTVYVTFDKVEEIENMLLVRVAPNPFSERTTIQLDRGNLAEGTVDIIDVTGRIIREEKFIGSSIVIERNNLESGIYYYIFTLNGSKATGKLIID